MRVRSPPIWLASTPTASHTPSRDAGAPVPPAVVASSRGSAADTVAARDSGPRAPAADCSRPVSRATAGRGRRPDRPSRRDRPVRHGAYRHPTGACPRLARQPDLRSSSAPVSAAPPAEVAAADEPTPGRVRQVATTRIVGRLTSRRASIPRSWPRSSALSASTARVRSVVIEFRPSAGPAGTPRPRRPGRRRARRAASTAHRARPRPRRPGRSYRSRGPASVRGRRPLVSRSAAAGPPAGRRSCGCPPC